MIETFASVIEAARHALADTSHSPRLDAELLTAHGAGVRRSTLHAWPERPLDADVCARINALVARRVAGEPLAYLVGRKEFWSLSLRVSTDTLVPRPETETLVAAALARCGPAPRILELGTGSGAIALALARERRGARVTATDCSPGALAVARENAVALGLDQIEFVLAGSGTDWYGCVGERRFDLIVSNPPYVASGDPALETGEIRFEPRQALAAGPDGLDALKTIVRGAPAHLADGGWLLLEHGDTQARAVTGLLQAAGFTRIATVRDLADRPRVSVGSRAQPGM